MIRPRESAHTAPYDRRVPPASQRAYLDHAATTPLVPAALEAFHAAAGVGGNASALHASGRRARAIVEDAREQIAAVLDAHPTEVVFIFGGIEADNLAIAGMYAARTARDPRPPGIVISAIEHHAVLEPVEALQRRGAQVCLVAPSRSGVVGADAVVNLSGASISRLPWTRGYRRTIVESRLTATRTLVRALHALYQHLDGAVGQLEHLQDVGDAADRVQILDRGLVLRGGFLGDEQDALARLHRILERLDALRTTDEERDDHVREHHHVAQRQQRHFHRFVGEVSRTRHFFFP